MCPRNKLKLSNYAMQLIYTVVRPFININYAKPGHKTSLLDNNTTQKVWITFRISANNFSVGITQSRKVFEYCVSAVLTIFRLQYFGN